jgi:hypothetical protein
MRGRKPTPTGLLRTRGTFRRDRHGMRQDAKGDLYAAPTGLTLAQRANWRYAIAHAPKGVLKKIDRGILKIWVEAEDRHFICDADAGEARREQRIKAAGPRSIWARTLALQQNSEGNRADDVSRCARARLLADRTAAALGGATATHVRSRRPVDAVAARARRQARSGLACGSSRALRSPIRCWCGAAV